MVEQKESLMVVCWAAKKADAMDASLAALRAARTVACWVVDKAD